MKRIIPLLLALLLLCGCGTGEAGESTEPSAAAQTTPVPGGATLLESVDDTISTYALDTGSCAKLLRLRENYVLLTTQGKLYLLSGPGLKVDQTRSLNCTFSPDDPSIQVREDRLCYFDSQRSAYVILDGSLTEISALTIKDTIVGFPRMSPDFSTIYYCTENGVRAMDTTDGTSRLLRQEHGTITGLEGLLFDGTILHYTRTVGEEEGDSSFIRTNDGSLAYCANLDGQVTTWGDTYAAALDFGLPMGSRRDILVGQPGGGVQALALPDPDYDSALFPGENLVLIQSAAGDSLKFELYDLTTGCAAAATDLWGYTVSFPCAWKEGENLWIWGDGTKQFYRWDLSQSQPSAESYLQQMRTLANPNQESLDECYTLAQVLSEQYGISIRLTEEENRTTGVDYSGYPDFRPTQYAEALERLQTALERFPEDFFPQLSGSAPLAIELVDDFDPAMDDYAGTGSLELGDERVIRVSVCADLESIFYHELFHAMELMIYGQTGELDDWGELNPKGFEYGQSMESDAFADDYAMTAPHEDRAQTFMYSMMLKQSDRFESSTMQKKLSLLCSAIRAAFDGYDEVETPFPWEQYLQG